MFIYLIDKLLTNLKNRKRPAVFECDLIVNVHETCCCCFSLGAELFFIKIRHSCKTEQALLAHMRGHCSQYLHRSNLVPKHNHTSNFGSKHKGQIQESNWKYSRIGALINQGDISMKSVVVFFLGLVVTEGFFKS